MTPKITESRCYEDNKNPVVMKITESRCYEIFCLFDPSIFFSQT